MKSDIATSLSGGDPRSLGRAEEVLQLVLKKPERLAELFVSLFSSDEIVRMRASDVLEKVAREQPKLVQPFLPQLLKDVPKIRQPSVQWHLAQIFTELDLNPTQKRTAVQIMKRNLTEIDEWVLANLTLEALAEYTRRGDLPKSELLPILKKFQRSRHNSVARRATKLLAEFSSS